MQKRYIPIIKPSIWQLFLKPLQLIINITTPQVNKCDPFVLIVAGNKLIIMSIQSKMNMEANGGRRKEEGLM